MICGVNNDDVLSERYAAMRAGKRLRGGWYCKYRNSMHAIINILYACLWLVIIILYFIMLAGRRVL